MRTILYGKREYFDDLTTNSCPECSGELDYEPNTRHFVCKQCGLYVTREQIYDMKDKDMPEQKKSRQDEYLDWWLSKKK